VRRAQVYVEALIAEVSADKAAQFGIQWQSLSGAAGTKTSVIGGTNLVPSGSGNIISASSNIGNVSEGLNIGVVKGQITLPGIGTVLNLGALANALQQDSNANILSAPNLLTLDNEEAKIVIGQNVPFITGQYAQTGAAATATPFQTIDRKDVGLTLKIKPQISEGGTVKLQIYQEVSSIDPTSLNNPAGIITNKRSLDSSVLVDEGQTVVLGGLIQDQVSTTETGVPLLSSIPLLGALFRYESRTHTKTDLMLFIRPHVLRTNLASDSLTQDRYEYLHAEEESNLPSYSLILPNMTTPKTPFLDIAKPASSPGTTGTPAPAAGSVDASNNPAAAAARNAAASAVPATVPPQDIPAADNNDPATGKGAAH
jgi:general secretion pathway protein D